MISGLLRGLTIIACIVGLFFGYIVANLHIIAFGYIYVGLLSLIVRFLIKKFRRRGQDLKGLSFFGCVLFFTFFVSDKILIYGANKLGYNNEAGLIKSMFVLNMGGVNLNRNMASLQIIDIFDKENRNDASDHPWLEREYRQWERAVHLFILNNGYYSVYAKEQAERIPRGISYTEYDRAKEEGMYRIIPFDKRDYVQFEPRYYREIKEYRNNLIKKSVFSGTFLLRDIACSIFVGSVLFLLPLGWVFTANFMQQQDEGLL